MYYNSKSKPPSGRALMQRQPEMLHDTSPRDAFEATLAALTGGIGTRALDEQLENWLNETYPADGTTFRKLASLVEQGASQGWLCQREADGIRFGRAIKPGETAGRFSVDVVRMDNIVGPHHVHTTGEIGMIIPINSSACFDGKGRGWYVYGPGSSHAPAVTDGAAYVLYLLPDGAIEFTRR
jgi:hypothetical protein